MQSHAEHQQDDANLGELVGDVLVGDVPGRERPDDDAREQIADQRRKAEALGDQDAEAEGKHEANRQGRYEGRHMLHRGAFNRRIAAGACARAQLPSPIP